MVGGRDNKKKRLTGGEQKPANPDLEDELLKLICDLRDKRLRVTMQMVTTEAIRLYNEKDETVTLIVVSQS